MTAERSRDHRLPAFFRRRGAWPVAGVALVGLVLYLGLAAALSEPGLPLDDGWIHQAYARNLAAHGRWQMTPGKLSAGSTAPLWTVMLALGYLIRAPYLVWTFLLGALCLIWLAWAGMALWTSLWPERSARAWAVGLVLVLSWPLLWAAASGMETLLYLALATQLLAMTVGHLKGGRPRVGIIGLLAGALVLARPDGLSLLLVVAAGIVLAGRASRTSLLNLGRYLLPAALLLLPYFALNLAAGGSLWPNTFYAKQAEYASLWEQSIVSRFVRLLVLSLGGPASGWRGMSGAHLTLLPGLMVTGWTAARRDLASRRFLHSLPLVWAIGHIFLYAWRLPVTYQHGRYLWPVLPVVTAYGLAGWWRIVEWAAGRFKASGRIAFLVPRVTGLTFGVLLLLFLLLGAQVYAQDVAFINREMVDIAHWLEENTPAGALIATHDIGAIGYFSRRPLLDLAGLVSPEVIPLLADEEALADYVRRSQADYLVTAPGWLYPTLTGKPDTLLVYSSDYPWTRDQGLNNMAVYTWE